jgi:hypothetical protein
MRPQTCAQHAQDGAGHPTPRLHTTASFIPGRLPPPYTHPPWSRHVRRARRRRRLRASAGCCCCCCRCFVRRRCTRRTAAGPLAGQCARIWCATAARSAGRLLCIAALAAAALGCARAPSSLVRPRPKLIVAWGVCAGVSNHAPHNAAPLAPQRWPQPHDPPHPLHTRTGRPTSRTTAMGPAATATTCLTTTPRACAAGTACLLGARDPACMVMHGPPHLTRPLLLPPP